MTLGDIALGDIALGDQALGDQALGDMTLGDMTLGDIAPTYMLATNSGSMDLQCECEFTWFRLRKSDMQTILIVRPLDCHPTSK